MNKYQKDLHSTAMNNVEIAVMARARGEMEEAKERYRKAYRYEKKCVHSYINLEQLSEWQLILIRSLATIAYHSGYIEDALSWISVGRARLSQYEQSHIDFYTRTVFSLKHDYKELEEKINKENQ